MLVKKSLCKLVEREGRGEVLAKNNPNGRCQKVQLVGDWLVYRSRRSDALFGPELHYQD